MAAMDKILIKYSFLGWIFLFRHEIVLPGHSIRLRGGKLEGRVMPALQHFSCSVLLPQTSLQTPVRYNRLSAFCNSDSYRMVN